MPTSSVCSAPLEDSLSPTAVDAGLLRMLRALCPEAADWLYGDEERTLVEQFCKEHPVPADVRL